MSDGMPIRHTWTESDRRVPRLIARPLRRALRHDAAGGVVMLVAALTAIVWANSPWSDSYFDLWSTLLRVDLGDVIHLDHLSLQAWVNDALMTIFFLLVGVEIKRELVHGQLQDLRAVTLPIIAAIGGMVVPAGIYFALNRGGAGVDGWAVPMATDIAFAVGIVSLLGNRVPSAAKIFLLTLAVADDLGAIAVIAVFYTDSLSASWLIAAAVGFLVIFCLRQSDVQSLAPYLAVGAFSWLCLLESGVHATLAGVGLGLLTPAWPLRSPRRLPLEARRILNRIEEAYYNRVIGSEEFEENEHRIAELGQLTIYSTSPLERLERGLAPWVSNVIIPIFALANAGVAVSGDSLRGVVDNRVTLGVTLGLVIGKTVGIFGASVIAVKLGLGAKPNGASWRHLLGVSMVAGVGFTVALFVTSLSFDSAQLTAAAKIGILVGSTIAGTVGYVILRSAGRTAEVDRRLLPEPV